MGRRRENCGSTKSESVLGWAFEKMGVRHRTDGLAYGVEMLLPDT